MMTVASFIGEQNVALVVGVKVPSGTSKGLSQIGGCEHEQR